MTDPILPGIRELEQRLNVSLHPQIHEMFRGEAGNPAIADTRAFLAEADAACRDISELPSDCDFGAVQQLFAHLALEQTVAKSDDGTLALTKVQHMVISKSHPNLWHLFFLVPGSKNYGLENENHGHGYHVHYVDTKKKHTRTNAVFTFNPTEAVAPAANVTVDTLYWYSHAGKLTVNPDGFAAKRKTEVHALCVGFLSNTPKASFLTPPRSAARLWP